VLAAPPAAPAVPRNCMPSLHTTWVLLLWWHARPLSRWVRALAGFYLGFTLLATLRFGVHFACDLLVAFPFALAVQAACTPASVGVAPVRLRAFLGGAALAGTWLLLILFGWRLLASAPVPVAVGALFTVATSLLGERALYRHAAGMLAADGDSREVCPVRNFPRLPAPRTWSDVELSYASAEGVRTGVVSAAP
jgi:hypothetical protein